MPVTPSLLSQMAKEAFEMTNTLTSPGYYKKSGLECRTAIRAATSNLVGEEAYNVGCAIKYLWRWKDKGGTCDLEKARQYIDFILDTYKEDISPQEAPVGPGAR